MRILRTVPGLIAQIAAMGALIVGLTAMTPDTYHDMSTTAAARSAASAGPTTTPSSSPDTYHDM